MKNFYEATVIKPTLENNVTLTLRPVGTVKAKIWICDELFNFEGINTITQVKKTVKLSDPIRIVVHINRKHPEAIQIELSVDGFEILPKYQHLASPPTDYVDNNTPWILEIPNFYPWYHKVTGQGWIA